MKGWSPFRGRRERASRIRAETRTPQARPKFPTPNVPEGHGRRLRTRHAKYRPKIGGVNGQHAVKSCCSLGPQNPTPRAARRVAPAVAPLVGGAAGGSPAAGVGRGFPRRAFRHLARARRFGLDRRTGLVLAYLSTDNTTQPSGQGERAESAQFPTGGDSPRSRANPARPDPAKFRGRR